MKEYKINNWQEFVEKIDQVEHETKRLELVNTNLFVSKPLYRGQSMSSWKLNSTLDRIEKNCTVLKYLRVIKRIKSQLQSFTSNRWTLRDDKIELDAINERDHFSTNYYKYMTHLRHHGFPSPLLDWSRSPYLAAFFAFNEAELEDVAIFMYRDDIGEGKTWAGSQARICLMGPNVTTHRRHHLQQCEYTFCIQEVGKKLLFANYEEAFKEAGERQDILEKYVIPISQRRDFLRRLNSMNINKYSLFESEEGMMNKLSNEEFVIKEY